MQHDAIITLEYMPHPPRVLLVDGDQRVLDALVRTLRGPFDPVPVTSVAAARAALVAQGPFAVVVSALRIPNGDGIAFLAAVYGCTRQRSLLPGGFRSLSGRIRQRDLSR